MKTQPIGNFLGINNRLPDFALGTDKGSWLRDAVNVDIDNAGRVRRRNATSLIQALSDPHSLYTTTSGTRYMVVGGSLYTVTLPAYTQTLFRVLSNDDPVNYVEYAGSLYYSNGTDSGRIESGVWFPWALPTPTAPSASVISGALYAGDYQVSVSHYNSVTGEEGGISASAGYTLASAGGLRITLPGTTAGANYVNVYVSTVNGSIPMLVATIAAGTALYDYVTPGSVGREANQRYEEPIPAGVPFIHNSRLCTCSGTTIYIGLPARPGYYIPTDPRLEFASDVTNAISGQNGVYVTADKTYWFAGTDLLDAQSVIDLLPYGAVPGTGFVTNDGNSIGWFSESGIVIATTGGEIKEAMVDAIDQTPPASGVSAVFSDGGYNRVVSCGWCMHMENYAATQYTDYSFTSISGTYATGPAGIYDLEATGKQDAHISFGKENFGSENLKGVPACYIGVASETPMELRVSTPDDEDYRYEARSSSTSLRIQRIDPGKGLRANWYDLSLYNTEGSDFTLASVSFAPVESGRRI